MSEINSVQNAIHRGQVYYIAGDAEHKPVGSEMWSDRPAVIVSCEVCNTYSKIVQVVYLTSKPKRISPIHVPVCVNHRPGLALCEQIHTVDKSRLRQLMHTLSEEEMSEIDAALQVSLGISAGSAHVDNLFKKWDYSISRYGLESEMEQNQLAEPAPRNTTRLERMLAKVTYERDGYKSLYEAAQMQY